MTYAQFLTARGMRLVRGGGIDWRLYQKALIPASPLPSFTRMTRDEAADLLRRSAAWMVRWSGEPVERPGPWWWTVCDAYDPARLSGKMRYQVRRALQRCSVRPVSRTWLADNGYPCYSRAFQRYSHAAPAGPDAFRQGVLEQEGFEDLFQNWGVFVGDSLAGYAQLIVEPSGAALSAIKYDPAFLAESPGYALMDALLSHYVKGLGCPVSNGERPISHDTDIQAFLLKFGFVHRYCRLNLVYSPAVSTVVSCAFPFRKPLKLLDNIPTVHRLNALLFQEGLVREQGVR